MSLKKYRDQLTWHKSLTILGPIFGISIIIAIIIDTPMVTSFEDVATMESSSSFRTGAHPGRFSGIPISRSRGRFRTVPTEEDDGSIGNNKATSFYSRLASGIGDSSSEPTKSSFHNGNKRNGPWGHSMFPMAPEEEKSSNAHSGMKMDQHGRVQMGVEDEHCDDAKTNLTVDWDFSPVDYTCFHPEMRFPLKDTVEPELHCVDLPPDYMPNHLCMDKPITYSDKIPTYGDHRPLWPKFGEYLYVPVQRWLHNIEHGSVVMLYHPCAHPEEVQRLRKLVTHCIGKHVITPNIDVEPERPLQLVAWGCSLKMAVVDEPTVINFIQEKSLKGPEGNYTKEGQFDFALLRLANETEGSRYDRITCGDLDQQQFGNNFESM